MTPEQRLNQLEPLVSEALAVLDRHTALHKQTQAQIGQLITAVAMQSDNISFILKEQAAMKVDLETVNVNLAGVKADVNDLKGELAGVKTDVNDLKGELAGVKTDVQTIHQVQVHHGEMLDKILSLLQTR